MNLHLRMETILTMVEANPGITGQRIVDACAVPWSIIKKDLETMLLSTENHIPLYTDQDDDVMTDDDIVIEFTPETKWFLDTYNRNNNPLHLTLGEAFQVLSSVYIDEKHPKLLSLRQKILNSLDLDNQGTFRYIKGSMTPVIDADEEVLLLIEQAISRRRQIGFAYNLLTITAIPLGLVYYSRLRQWYLAAINDSIIKTFNISKIQDIKEIPKTFVYPSDFSLKDWLAPRWGMEFGDPLKVKVRFINRAQTIAKVRKDVAHRQCKLTEENGGESLLYEDIIIGRNEFLAWVLGFGSAATVLEPVDLRDEIIVRIKDTLGNYK
jgi:Predicted transcriptional regulator